jgi:hypothetical protein
VTCVSARKLPLTALECLSRGERVVVVRDGERVAALISVEDLALFERLIEEAEDRSDVEAAREALSESGSIPWENLKEELGL